MKCLKMLLLPCFLMTFFLSEVKSNPEVQDRIKQTQKILTLFNQQEKEVLEDSLLRLYPDPKKEIKTFLGGISQKKIEKVQELALHIDESQLIFTLIAINVHPHVIIRFIEYIKTGIPTRLNDIVSEAFAAAAYHSQYQIMKELLQYNPDFNAQYANKTAYESLQLKEQEETSALFQEMLYLTSITVENFFQLKNESLDAAKKLIQRLVNNNEIFEIRFPAIFNIFKILYTNFQRIKDESIYFNFDTDEGKPMVFEEDEGDQDELDFITSVSNFLLPEQIIKLISLFLTENLENHAFNLFHTIILFRINQNDSTFMAKLTSLLPEIPQYRHNTHVYKKVNEMLNKRYSLKLFKETGQFIDEIQIKQKNKYQEKKNL